MKAATIVLAVLLINFESKSQVDPIDKKTKVAIGGYDPVSYFKGIKPQKGNSDISVVHEGHVYLFTSKENKEAFNLSPEKYLPQYDGFCALAVTQNRKVSIDPETYKITNGKLYLFYNGPLPFKHEKFNSLEPWLKDESNLIKKADSKWPDVKKKKF